MAGAPWRLTNSRLITREAIIIPRKNRDGEQFLFAFDQVTRAGTIWRGDLGWDVPRPFILDQLEEAVRNTAATSSAAQAAG